MHDTDVKGVRTLIMRSAVIIRMADSVAMIERVRAGKTYYLFPGGTVETGETLEMAAIREVREELGLDICVGQLAAQVVFNGQSQYYFWANQVSGEFGTGDGEELRLEAESPGGSYRSVWLLLEQFPLLDVRPKALATALWEGRIHPWSEALKLQEW
jgi:8-oxo-dGTP diphosphatase